MDTRTITISERLECPRCGRLAFEARPRSGDLVLDCERRSCGISWWAIVLPPGATGRHLTTIFSADVAAAVLRSLSPEAADWRDEDLFALLLAPYSRRAYIQIIVDGRTKHRSLHLDNDGMAVAALARGGPLRAAPVPHTLHT